MAIFLQRVNGGEFKIWLKVDFFRQNKVRGTFETKVEVGDFFRQKKYLW